MGRAIRIVVLSLVLAATGWQAGVHYQRTGIITPEAQDQADRKLRAYVMSQDMAWLRAELIELHKTHFDTQKQDSKEAAAAAAVLGIAFAGALGLLTWEIFKRRNG